MPEFRIELFSNTADPRSLETAIQEITKLLVPALEKADQLAYTSFILVTELETSQTNNAMFMLSDFALGKNYTSPRPEFSFPNVFAPIIADPAKASDEGTVFLTNENDHIIIQDKYPSAPIHYLVIPKNDKVTILEMPVYEVAKLYVHAIEAALQKLTLKQARLLINVATPNQEVPHVHLHIMSSDLS
jgi:diadenosine tetraphosphate (Ap4A) HIT family hydrolase